MFPKTTKIIKKNSKMGTSPIHQNVTMSSLWDSGTKNQAHKLNNHKTIYIQLGCNQKSKTKPKTHTYLQKPRKTKSRKKAKIETKTKANTHIHNPKYLQLSTKKKERKWKSKEG